MIAPQHFSWHKTKGDKSPGPPSDPPCLDSLYFPNDFTVEKGLKSLGAYQNYRSADTTRIYCKSCFTNLLANHPVYAGKFVLTQASNYKGFESLQDADLSEPPLSRHFTKDLSEMQKKALPSWKGAADKVYDGVSADILAAIPDMLANNNAGEEMNVGILLKKIGRPFIPRDEQELMAGGPPSLGAQARAAAAPTIDPAPDGATEMKVTTKRSEGFYSSSACSFLRGVEAKPAEGDKEAQEAKPPVDNLRISGTGAAAGAVVAAALKVTSEGLGTITRIQTAYPTMEGSGKGCAQILVDIKKA